MSLPARHPSPALRRTFGSCAQAAPRAGSGAGAGELDVDLERRQLIASLELDVDTLVTDSHVALDDFQNIALEERQVFRARAVGALVRQENMQTLLGGIGGIRLDAADGRNPA